jgi:nucleoside-diphosphate-sugar epimerase
MRVFVTGATGFVGSAIVQELIDAGHQVLGLTRSEAGAQLLLSHGAEAHRGDLENPESLRSGATDSDAVIHTAFNHDFSKYRANCEADRQVIKVLGDALAGSAKLLIVTSGTAMTNSEPGILATEHDLPASSKVVPRAASEEAAASLVPRGIRVAIVRLPQVHDTKKQGLITYAIQVAREKGVSAYVCDGLNRWPAAHRFDTARLYRLALEKAGTGDTFHAVAEEGVPVRDIAEAIGRGLKIPAVPIPAEESSKHFGWLAAFVGRDIPASSVDTREKLGWNPTGPDLITDLENMRYFPA